MIRLNRYLLCLFGIICSVGLPAKDLSAWRSWSTGTALTVASHHGEIGILSPSRLGLSDKVEISAHPLMFFLIPRAEVKVNWVRQGNFYLASEHGFLYPTMFMNLVSAKGIGGLVSPEFTFPQTIGIDNRVRASWILSKSSLLSAHAGISFSINSGSVNSSSSIDLPYIYPRLAVFYQQPVFDAGFNFRARFNQFFGGLISIENFIIPGQKGKYFFENKGVVTYFSKGQHIRIEGGYKLFYGNYPFGRQWHLLPAIDLVFEMGRRD